MWKNTLGYKTEQVLGIRNRGKSIKTVFPISYVSQYPEKWTQVVSWDNLHEETILSKVCNFKIRLPLKVLSWSLQFTSIDSSWKDLFNWKKRYFIILKWTSRTKLSFYVLCVQLQFMIQERFQRKLPRWSLSSFLSPYEIEIPYMKSH